MDVRIIITGGTIDKCYDMIKGELVFTETHMNELISNGRIDHNINIENLLLKDSLDMNEEDRKSLTNHCNLSVESHILISHGTDTMVETAIELAKGNKDKVIVLFGAMIPYEFKNSDAQFNFGVAMSALQFLNSGVYIAMNGRVFQYDNVEKNREIGAFQCL